MFCPFGCLRLLQLSILATNREADCQRLKVETFCFIMKRSAKARFAVTLQGQSLQSFNLCAASPANCAFAFSASAAASKCLRNYSNSNSCLARKPAETTNCRMSKTQLVKKLAPLDRLLALCVVCMLFFIFILNTY